MDEIQMGGRSGHGSGPMGSQTGFFNSGMQQQQQMFGQQQSQPQSSFGFGGGGMMAGAGTMGGGGMMSGAGTMGGGGGMLGGMMSGAGTTHGGGMLGGMMGNGSGMVSGGMMGSGSGMVSGGGGMMGGGAQQDQKQYSAFGPGFRTQQPQVQQTMPIQPQTGIGRFPQMSATMPTPQPHSQPQVGGFGSTMRFPPAPARVQPFHPPAAVPTPFNPMSAAPTSLRAALHTVAPPAPTPTAPAPAPTPVAPSPAAPQISVETFSDARGGGYKLIVGGKVYEIRNGEKGERGEPCVPCAHADIQPTAPEPIRPYIDRLSKYEGAAGDTITIYGDNFLRSGSHILFGEERLFGSDIYAVSANEIRLKVPKKGSSSIVQIVVSNDNWTESNSAEFKYLR